MNNVNLTDAHKLLVSRIEDYLRASERGELACGCFLTPGEAAFAADAIKELKASDRVFFFGGYRDAERKRIFAIPSYLSDFDGSAEEKAQGFFSDKLHIAVKALKLQGSGYRELNHRDYLGSLLALGIERDSIGDIVVTDRFSAVVFCTDKIFDFLLREIDRIASDKVTVSEFNVPDDFCPKREFVTVTDTIASNRLDCVVGALTNLSREKSQSLVRSGLCEVNYLPEQRCDTELKLPCVVTLRGYGKFNVISFDGETKRGRLRLIAQKYV
jgi:RNA-binding protein YlmH